MNIYLIASFETICGKATYTSRSSNSVVFWVNDVNKLYGKLWRNHKQNHILPEETEGTEVFRAKVGKQLNLQNDKTRKMSAMI